MARNALSAGENVPLDAPGLAPSEKRARFPGQTQDLLL
jgi:hypothetical protein